MPFQKGNQLYKKRTDLRPWQRALERRSRVEKAKALDEIADALIAEAKKGNVQAIKEFGDRLDGKVPQGIIGSGEEGEFIHRHYAIELIRPKGSVS